MKIHEFGDKDNPVLLLLPGTCCYWRSNFKKVIEPLAENFRVGCVSYDGFEETEQSEFPTMLEETEKLENYITEHFGGHVRGVYGCSLGGSFVGLLAARERIHMDYGILGGSDLDQMGKIPARLMTKLLLPVIYPYLVDGRFKIEFLNKIMDKRNEADDYQKAFMEMMDGAGTDLHFITKKSAENQFYSDLITPLPNGIDPKNTQIHILYALKMGEKYERRYKQHFANPVIHRLAMQHEELLAVHPADWVKLIEEICDLSGNGRF